MRYLTEEKKAAKVTIDITLKSNKMRSLSCVENFMFGTTFKEEFNYFVRAGSHQLQMTFDNPRDIIDFKKNGITFYNFCGTWLTNFYGILEQVGMFAGGLGLSNYIPTMGDQLTNYQKEQSKDLIEKTMRTTLEKRVIDVVEIDKKEIKSGDLFLVRRLDGV